MNNILNQMVMKYNPNNIDDEINAIKEIMQEIILCGLSRSGFFKVAAFYGGTALRIFHGLDRFSEDLDFALINPNKEFKIDSYLPYVIRELASYGIDVQINEKNKSIDSNIISAFLTNIQIFNFFSDKNYDLNHLFKQIKIKIEIDINPPLGANYQSEYKLLPSAHDVNLYDLPSLFAGKIHAILCRNWQYRTKGRDLYDFIFFISLNVPVNLELLKNKLIDSKYDFNAEDFNLDSLLELLNNKFKNIDYENAKSDVINFLKQKESLDLWSYDFFSKISKNIKYE